MASKQFQAEMTQFKSELDALYKKAQAMLLRHGADSPHAAKMIMPHLEMARTELDKIANPPVHSGD